MWAEEEKLHLGIRLESEELDKYMVKVGLRWELWA
jgi:hypothetical protein